MLRFQQIEIENFGPYKGRQVLEFPDRDGVIVVYGENGRGKTSLLNAFRYALFGKVRREGHDDVSLHRIPNLEAAREGTFGFKVVVRFTFAGRAYELTRAALPLDGVAPQSSDDFREEALLRKDGVVLGPAERDSELAQIMPEEVSRFFLFDGELLREYEELLKRESTLGDEIKEAIERILGVPVLKHARIDLDALHERAQRQARSVAAKSREGEQLAAELENLAAERKHLQEEVERMEGDHKDLIGEKTDLDAFLRQYAQVKARLDRRRRLEEDVEGAQNRIEDLRSRLKAAMSTVWRGMLSEKVQASRDRVRDELEGYRTRAAAADLARRIESALSQGTCPTCSQPVSGDAERRLQRELEEVRDGGAPEDLDRQAVLARREARLKNFGLTDNRGLVKQLSEDLSEAIVEKETIEAELEEVKQLTADFKEREKDIGAKYDRYDRVVEEMKALQDGIAANKTAIEEKKDLSRDIEQNLKQLGNSDIDAAQRRADYYGRLYSLFNEGVGVYRDQLRDQVEADASRLFANLTHEPEYAGLRINDNYGLNIVLEDGTEIPGHSAGEGQVVALSLIGALQKNAPLQGPIIMDSSFTRLDGDHRRNLLRALPDMSPQVVLLVFEEELEPKVVREHVGGLLLAEYEMNRQSATHTVLQSKVLA